MFKVEVVQTQYLTCTLSDEDERKVLGYIKNNPDKFEYMTNKRAITKAVGDLYYDCQIELFDSFVESDCSVDEINWSEFEEREPEEIVGE